MATRSEQGHKTSIVDINANTEKPSEDDLENEEIPQEITSEKDSNKTPPTKKAVERKKYRKRSSTDGADVRRSTRKRKHTFQDSSTLYFIDNVEHDDLFEEVMGVEDPFEPPKKAVRLEETLQVETMKQENISASPDMVQYEKTIPSGMNKNTLVDNFMESKLSVNNIKQQLPVNVMPVQSEQENQGDLQSQSRKSPQLFPSSQPQYCLQSELPLAEEFSNTDELTLNELPKPRSPPYCLNRESILLMAHKLKAAEKRLLNKLYSTNKPSISSEMVNSDGIETRPVKRHLWTKSDTLDRMLAKVRSRLEDEQSPEKQQVLEQSTNTASEPGGLHPQEMDASPLLNLASAWQTSAKDLSNGLPKKHQCSKCDYQTDNRSHLKRHENSVHNDTKEYFCYVCYREFGRPEKIRSHVTKCHPEVPYNPSATRKTSPGVPKKEIIIPVSPEQIRNGSFQSQHSIVKSLLSAPSVNVNKTPVKTPIKHTCPICFYTGKDAWHLKRHMSDVHNLDKEYKCPQCSYETSRKHRLISHMKNHGVLSCIYCPYTTECVDIYQEHLKQCRLLSKCNQYFCTQCNGGFSSRYLYACHLQTYHGKSSAEAFGTGFGIDMRSSPRSEAGTPSPAKSNHIDTYDRANKNHQNTDYYCGSCSQFFISLSDFETHVARYHPAGRETSTN